MKNSLNPCLIWFWLWLRLLSFYFEHRGRCLCVKHCEIKLALETACALKKKHLTNLFILLKNKINKWLIIWKLIQLLFFYCALLTLYGHQNGYFFKAKERKKVRKKERKKERKKRKKERRVRVLSGFVWLIAGWLYTFKEMYGLSIMG